MVDLVTIEDAERQLLQNLGLGASPLALIGKHVRFVTEKAKLDKPHPAEVAETEENWAGVEPPEWYPKAQILYGTIIGVSTGLHANGEVVLTITDCYHEGTLMNTLRYHPKYGWLLEGQKIPRPCVRGTLQIDIE